MNTSLQSSNWIGADEYLAKPFVPRKLIDIVDRLLGTEEGEA